MRLRLRSLALCAVAAFAAMSLGANAQISPDDSGFGTKFGMHQLNNSGQVGTVTLFKRGNNTLVILNIDSVPEGRSEPAHIHRGHTCDEMDPKPAYSLAPVVNGVSKTLVSAPESKLLSGNYVVNVHASLTNLAHYVSCGQLINS